MSFPTIRQQKPLLSSDSFPPPAATSSTLNSTAVAGNQLVVCFAGDKNTGTLTVTDNIGTNGGANPWVQRISQPGGEGSLYLFTKVAVGGESTITATTQNVVNGGGNSGLILELVDDGTGAWKVMAQVLAPLNTADRSSVSSGTTDTADYDGLGVAVAMIDSLSSLTDAGGSDSDPTFSNSYVKPGNFTPGRAPGAGGGNAGCYVGVKNIGSGTTTSTTFSTNVSGGDDALSLGIVVLGREEIVAVPLVVDGARASSRTGRPLLAQDHPLTVDGARSVGRASGVQLAQATPVVVDGSRSVGRAPFVPLAQTQPLQVSPARSGARAGRPLLAQDSALAVDGARSQARAAAPALAQNHPLAVDDARAPAAAGVPGLAAEGALVVRSARAAGRAGRPILAQRAALAVAHSRAPSRTPRPLLGQRSVLVVRSARAVARAGRPALLPDELRVRGARADTLASRPLLAVRIELGVPGARASTRGAVALLAQRAALVLRGARAEPRAGRVQLGPVLPDRVLRVPADARGFAVAASPRARGVGADPRTVTAAASPRAFVAAPGRRIYAVPISDHR